MKFLNHQSFGLSAATRFFTEDDGGGSGGDSSAGALDTFEAPPDTTDMDRGRNQERVEGEKPPDFSALGSRKTAPKEEEGGEPPAEGQKPAGGDPAKPAAPKKETPEAAKPAKKEAEAKKPVEKKPEAGQKPAEKKPEAKEAAAKPDEKKIMTDAEIDALQPRADAPKQVVENFKQMRTSMKALAQTAREAQAAKDALAKEVETLKSTSGKLPDEVSKELEEARHFKLLFDAQNHPEFRKEYDGKIQASTEAVYAMLAQHGLKEDVIKQIKDIAEKNGGDIEKWPHWGALINKFTDPLAKQEAINAISNRRQAIKAKTEKLNSLAADRNAYIAEMEAKDKAQKDAWAKELETHSMAFGADFEPAMEKEIPEGATEDVKKAIEAHNAGVLEVAKQFKENVLGAYKRDPKAIAEMAFSKVKADHLDKELKGVRAELEKEKARRTEAEEKLAKVKSAGRLAHVEAPGSGAAKKTGTTTEEGKIGGDGHNALQTFFANR